MVPDTAKKIVSIHAKPKRRNFTTEYKLKILEEVERADQHGQIGFILRREGIYSSHLNDWRKWRERLSTAGFTKPSTGSSSSLKHENERLLQQNQRLQKKLDQANLVIELQKKLNLTLAQLELLDVESSQ